MSRDTFIAIFSALFGAALSAAVTLYAVGEERKAQLLPKQLDRLEALHAKIDQLGEWADTSMHKTSLTPGEVKEVDKLCDEVSLLTDLYAPNLKTHVTPLLNYSFQFANCALNSRLPQTKNELASDLKVCARVLLGQARLAVRMLITKSQEGIEPVLLRPITSLSPAIVTRLEKDTYGVVFMDSLGYRVYERCNVEVARQFNPYTSEVERAFESIDAITRRRDW